MALVRNFVNVGYCFSASLPPLLAGTGIQALKMVEDNPAFVEQLQENCVFMHGYVPFTIYEVYHSIISNIKLF